MWCPLFSCTVESWNPRAPGDVYPYMRHNLVVVTGAVLLGVATLAGRQAPQPAGQLERPFNRGGVIRMDLGGGAYTIRGTAAEAIRARWQTRDPADMKRVTADLSVTGSAARLRTSGARQNFRMDIDVPDRTNIDIELSAGDLSVKGIEGDKRLDMWAGDVTIEVGDGQAYRRVDATVRAGEITAVPFGRTTGGLFRSLHWNGGGKYTLHAKLAAGDLKLVR